MQSRHMLHVLLSLSIFMHFAAFLPQLLLFLYGFLYEHEHILCACPRIACSTWNRDLGW